MTKRERIVEFFKSLKTSPEQIAFIIALELSGDNLVANSCKEVLEFTEAK